MRLALFGSMARGDTAPNDIDLLATLGEHRKLSLLDVIHIENQISDFRALKRKMGPR